MTSTEPFVDSETLVGSERDDWIVGVVILGSSPADIRVVVTEHALIPEGDVSISGSDQHY